jgi:hypothetical protein
MRFFIVFCLCTSFVACGGNGGSSSLPSPIPYGTVKGVAHDNILVGSTITVYQYAGGTKGAALGTATTNNDGNYSLSVQCETSPLLIEATGGYYIEEASRAQVNLKAGQVLRAVINFKTSDDITTQLTPFTHIAAGLAEYRIKQGTDTGTAIDSANQDVSALVGFDIVKTKPIDVTNALNATVYVSNEHLYGFLSAAISNWTLYASNKVEHLTPHANFNSIALAQIMYKDITSDGILDGKGLDDTLQIVPLAFGILPLNANVYRHAFAAHMIQFADQSENNHTNLKGSSLQSFAAAYAGYSGAIFGNALPVPFVDSGRPVIDFPPVTSTGWLTTVQTSTLFTGGTWTHPALTFGQRAATGWVGGSVSVSATVSSQGSIDSVVYSLDGSDLSVQLGILSSPSFTLDTTQYTESPHLLSVLFTDSFGIRSTQTQTVSVDNTPPASTVSFSYYGNWVPHAVTGTASDALSGLETILPSLVNNNCYTFDIVSGAWKYNDDNLAPLYHGPTSIELIDKAGNCSHYYDTLNYFNIPFKTWTRADCVAGGLW